MGHTYIGIVDTRFTTFFLKNQGNPLSKELGKSKMVTLEHCTDKNIVMVAKMTQ
jgi:hypothetical protein